jgi:hypothetical protein
LEEVIVAPIYYGNADPLSRELLHGGKAARPAANDYYVGRTAI